MKRYLCQFRSVGKDYFITDCGFDTEPQATSYVDTVVDTLTDVAEGKVFDALTRQVTYERTDQMKPRKYHRLPQPRVDKATYEGIHQIADEQEMSIAEVIRAALKEYVTPSEPPEHIAIPIAGKIKPYKGEYIILPTRLFGDRQGAGQQKGSPHNGRYLEVEQFPPSAPSLAQKS